MTVPEEREDDMLFFLSVHDRSRLETIVRLSVLYRLDRRFVKPARSIMIPRLRTAAARRIGLLLLIPRRRWNRTRYSIPELLVARHLLSTFATRRRKKSFPANHLRLLEMTKP